MSDNCFMVLPKMLAGVFCNYERIQPDGISYIYIYVAKLRVVDNFQNIVAGEETRVYYFEPIR